METVEETGQVRVFWDDTPVDLFFTNHPFHERAAANAEHVPFATSGEGYYALVRHADVVEASRNPDVFCSGKGATSIVDLPIEFNEYFGSMINMDDPRHGISG